MIELFIALLLFFRQAGNYLGSDYESAAFFAGNFDLFFILGIIGLFFASRQAPFYRWLMVLVVIGFVQFFAISGLEHLNFFVYIAKLVLCISVLFLAKLKFFEIRIDKVVTRFTALVALGTATALAMGPTNLLWTIDSEGINQFASTRLKLTFIEPSELGFTLVIVIFLLTYLFLSTKKRRTRILYASCIVINLLALFLAQSFGAIIIGAIAALAMVLFQFMYAKPTLRRQFASILLIFTFVGILLITFMPNTVLKDVNNPIVQRALSAASGDDASISYRTDISWAVVGDSFVEHPVLGRGFGSIGSQDFIDEYYNLGLRTTITNSFLSFITETGVVGIIVLIYIVYRLYSAAIRSRQYVAFGLVTFVVIYQLTGGHFNDPFVWCVYGVILAFGDSVPLANKMTRSRVKL